MSFAPSGYWSSLRGGTARSWTPERDPLRSHEHRVVESLPCVPAQLRRIERRTESAVAEHDGLGCSVQALVNTPTCNDITHPSDSWHDAFSAARVGYPKSHEERGGAMGDGTGKVADGRSGPPQRPFPFQRDAWTKSRVRDIAALLDRAGDSAIRARNVALALDCYAAALDLRLPDQAPAVEEPGSAGEFSVRVSHAEPPGNRRSTSSE